ncbi:MAG: hypothetical protein ACLFR1_00785 [Spirochaetia bacterium]
MKTGIFYVKFRTDLDALEKENHYLSGMIRGLTAEAFKMNQSYPVLALEKRIVTQGKSTYTDTFFLIPIEKGQQMLWLSSELFVYAGLRAREK